MYGSKIWWQNKEDLEKIKEISTYLERLDKTDYLLSTFIDKFQDIVLEVTR